MEERPLGADAALRQARALVRVRVQVVVWAGLRRAGGQTGLILQSAGTREGCGRTNRIFTKGGTEQQYIFTQAFIHTHMYT